MRRAARFSRDRRYRYVLAREWDASRPRCGFVLLNPSTADERVDDPTIRRCIGFARDWGYGGAIVVNVYALRATRPAVLRRATDPIGPANSRAIRRAARDADLLVLGWGVHGAPRGPAVRRLLAPYGEKLRVLGLTRAGEPRHPLYLRRATPPVRLSVR